jgi:hypothetical protein
MNGFTKFFYWIVTLLGLAFLGSGVYDFVSYDIYIDYHEKMEEKLRLYDGTDLDFDYELESFSYTDEYIDAEYSLSFLFMEVDNVIVRYYYSGSMQGITMYETSDFFLFSENYTEFESTTNETVVPNYFGQGFVGPYTNMVYGILFLGLGVAIRKIGGKNDN